MSLRGQSFELDKGLCTAHYGGKATDDRAWCDRIASGGYTVISFAPAERGHPNAPAV